MQTFLVSYFSASPPQPFARIRDAARSANDPSQHRVLKKYTDLCTLHSAPSAHTICSWPVYSTRCIQPRYLRSRVPRVRALTRTRATLMRHVVLLAVAEPLP
jgi:hypothetical protein